MEDFVRKTKGVRDINSLPLNVNHELDLVSDVKGKIYIKILNRYKELLFDNGTEPWVVEMLNNLEVDVEQLKEDILDLEQALSELPMISDKLEIVETKLSQINTLFTQMQTDVNGLDLRTAELEREVVQLALKDQELLDKINNLNVDLDVIYSNTDDFGDYDYSGRPNLMLNLDFSKVSKNASLITEPPAYVKDGGSHFVFDFSDPSANDVNRTVYIPKTGRLEKGATYIVTVPIMISDDFSTNYGGSPIYPYCVSANNVVERVTTLYPDNSCRGKWGFIKKTFTVPANISDGEFIFFQVYSVKDQTGKLYIGYDIKIEKVNSVSDTATPYQPNLLVDPYWLSKEPLNENIPYYKYVGINLKSSTNPNDYTYIPMDEAAKTVDDRLTKTITTYDTVNALQNNRLTALESKVVDTDWTNVTPISPFTTVQQIQVKRKNGIVYMRGILSDGVGDCFTLPEGFRPPNDEYEYHYLLPGRSTVQTDAAKIYVRPNGLCSIVSKTGTTPIFLEPIQFSIT